MEEHWLIEKGYIPFDKSWMMRLGVLDLLKCHDNMINFLSHQTELSEDLEALLRASKAWKKNEPIDVGESGTLYRCLMYAAWKRNEPREFIKRGTLKDRKICNDPSIIHWPLEKLLTLDGGTTQWVTASLLNGAMYAMLNPPPKIQLTYDAIQHWTERRAKKMCWEEREDMTLFTQALCYEGILEGRRTYFPEHSEDYCFARALGFITRQEGEKRWPQLAHHESNRLDAMEEAMKAALSGQTIVSDDHRVVQAMAMWGKVNNVQVYFSNPNAVRKSWPQFWRYLEVAKAA